MLFVWTEDTWLNPDVLQQNVHEIRTIPTFQNPPVISKHCVSLLLSPCGSAQCWIPHSPTGDLPKYLWSELNMSLFIIHHRQPIKIKKFKRGLRYCLPLSYLSLKSAIYPETLVFAGRNTPDSIQIEAASPVWENVTWPPTGKSRQTPLPHQMIDRCVCVCVLQAWLIH